MLKIALLFILGVIVMLLSGTDGHIETMNYVSYTGLGIICLSLVLPFILDFTGKKKIKKED